MSFEKGGMDDGDGVGWGVSRRWGEEERRDEGQEGPLL